MKKTIFMVIIASCLIFASCLKKSDNEEQPQAANKVSIIGTD